MGNCHIYEGIGTCIDGLLPWGVHHCHGCHQFPGQVNWGEIGLRGKCYARRTCKCQRSGKYQEVKIVAGVNTEANEEGGNKRRKSQVWVGAEVVLEKTNNRGNPSKGSDPPRKVKGPSRKNNPDVPLGKGLNHNLLVVESSSTAEPPSQPQSHLPNIKPQPPFQAESAEVVKQLDCQNGGSRGTDQPLAALPFRQSYFSPLGACL